MIVFEGLNGGSEKVVTLGNGVKGFIHFFPTPLFKVLPANPKGGLSVDCSRASS